MPEKKNRRRDNTNYEKKSRIQYFVEAAWPTQASRRDKNSENYVVFSKKWYNSGYSYQLITLTIIGVFLFFLLRRFVFRVFPLFLLLAVLISLIAYLYRRHKYRELEEVYEEYAALLGVLREKGLLTYTNLVEKSMNDLLSARNRAENITAMLSRENPSTLQNQIKKLKAEISKCRDKSQEILLQKQLQEMGNNQKNIEKLQLFLDNFESSKKVMVGYLKNIRMKLQMDILAEEQVSEEKMNEIDQIIVDVENINQIYERVDRVPEE